MADPQAGHLNHSPPPSPSPASAAEAQPQRPKRASRARGGTPQVSEETHNEHVASTVSTPLESGHDLVTDSAGVLEALGLRASRRMQSIVCLHCSSLIQRGQEYAHFFPSKGGARHTINRKQFNHAKLEDALASLDFQLSTRLPEADGPVFSGRPLQFAGLAPPVIGFKCTGCKRVAVKANTLTNSKSGCRAAHGCDKGKPADVQHGFWVQTAGLRKSAFEVTVGTKGPSTVAAEDVIDALLKELDDNLDQPQPAAQVDTRNHVQWLLTLRWIEHVGDHTHESLIHIRDLPTPDDPLRRVVDGVNVFLEKARSLVSRTDEIALQLLNTDEANGPFNHKPFGEFMSSSSYVAYTQAMVRLLILLLRTRPEDNQAYDMHLPLDVQQAVQRLYVAVTSPDTSDFAIAQEIRAVCRNIFRRAWAKTANNTSVPDPTLRAVVLAALNPNRGWDARGARVTPMIAKLKWCIRLTCLDMAHELFEAQPAGDPANKMVYEFVSDLARVFQSGYHTTFHTLTSASHLVSHAVYDTHPVPDFIWTDETDYREFKYKGERVYVDDMGKMSRAVEDEIVSLLDELKFNKPVEVPYSAFDIRDDARNDEYGYSLFDDPKNLSTMNDSRRRLLRELIQDPKLNGEYFETLGDGRIRLQEHKAAQWLRKYERLSHLFLLAMEISGGGPARSTELTAMTFRNGAHSIHRNLILINDHLCILRFYSKMSARTGRESRIPEALPAGISWALVQNLAILRPLAEIFARYVHRNHTRLSSILAMYHTALFPAYDNFFKVDDLSRILVQFSTKHLGVRLTVRSWRHIVIALKRKLLRIVDALIENMEHTVDAAHAGHGDTVDWRLYGVSGNVYEGAREDIVPLFLEASRRWHAFLQLIPGGKRLDRDEAMHDCFTDAHRVFHSSNPDIVLLAELVNKCNMTIEQSVNEVKEMIPSDANVSEISNLVSEIRSLRDNIRASRQDPPPLAPPSDPSIAELVSVIKTLSEQVKECRDTVKSLQADHYSQRPTPVSVAAANTSVAQRSSGSGRLLPYDSAPVAVPIAHIPAASPAPPSPSESAHRYIAQTQAIEGESAWQSFDEDTIVEQDYPDQDGDATMDDDLYDQHRVDVESAEPKSPLGPLSDEQFANVETNAPRPPSPALAHREPSVPAPASKPSSLVNPLPPASTASVASTGVLNAKVPHASNPSEQQPTFVKLTVAAPRRPPASRLKYTVLPDHRTTTTPGTEHAATVPASTVLAPAVRLPAVGYSTSQQSPAKISKVVPTASSAVKHTPAPARLSPTQSSYPSAAFDTFISLSTEELEKRVFHKMTDVMGFRVCKWRSEGQRLSVRRALAHQESFVTVLPTGSGKTMIPLSCAALDPDSLNMYIAPLNSVLAMASEAAHSPLLHSQLYETGVPIRSDTRLLIASADKASYSDFFRVISTALDAYPYLRVRYFVDEGHIPVTDDEFRRRLRVMRELLAPGPAQMIVMSATIPPAMETRLMDTYGLDPAHTSVIRTTTHRNEIMYDVKAEQKSVENAVDAAFQDFSQHSSAGDRAIIFVRDARDGRRACARLKQLTGREPSFYYGGSAAKSLGVPKQSDQEHRTIADDWENGLTGNFIVATSAYGSGVNCPNVAHVYHIRVPTTVLNYVQESGRAGRMGQLSRAVVFLVSSNDGYTKSKKDGSTFFGLPPVPETDIAGVGVVRELFTSGTRYCIRAQLAQFVDGTPTKCSDFTVPCGPCARRGLMARNPMPPHEHAIIGSTSSSPPSLLGKRAHGDIDPFEDAHMRAREARANRLYLESLAANALRPALDFFADKCGFCAAMGQEDVERHATRTCSSMKAAVDPYPHPVLPDTPSHFPGKPTNYLDVYFQRFQIRYQVDPVYPVCYKCHLPQVQGIEHDEEFVAGFDEPCAEEDLFLSVAFGVAANEGLWTLAQTRFVAGGWSDINAYMSWLADGHTDENKLSLTNIQRIFVWCADHLESVLRSQAQARAAAHGRRPGFAL